MAGHTVGGTQTSRDLGAVTDDVAVEADRSAVDLTADADITVTVAGERNSVTVRGDGAVDLVLSGERNSVTVGEAVDLTVTDEGRANSVGREEFGFDSRPELVQRSRDEAYAELGWFGFSVVSYQTEATEREYCHSCGTDADTVVHRHEERVLTLLGLSVTVRNRARSDQCPHCTDYVPDVELTEDERREIYG
jgi:hypothetical protein